MSDLKIDIITQIIGLSFCSFGGGKEGSNNILAEALKDQPLQFAAGVDIKEVVKSVLTLNDNLEDLKKEE